MGLKEKVKCSQFAIGQVRSLRGLKTDLRTLYCFLRRNRQIAAYFKANAIRRVQIGTSNSPTAGWLNTDLLPTSGSVVYLDASKRFPFPDASIDYINAEHMIEHLDYLAGQFMLRECYRVLRPSGRVRMSTPDLSILLGLHSNRKSSIQEQFIDFSVRRHLSVTAERQDVFVINNAFRAWGHQFLYDQDTLKSAFISAGFQSVSFHKPGESDDASLQNLETHGAVVGSEEMNSFETMVIEAQK